MTSKEHLQVPYCCIVVKATKQGMPRTCEVIHPQDMNRESKANHCPAHS